MMSLTFIVTSLAGMVEYDGPAAPPPAAEEL
jgi:hypothetical protein